MRAVALVYRPSTLTPGPRVVAIWTQFTAWQRTWLIPGLFTVVVAIQAPVIWAACKTYGHTSSGGSLPANPARYWVCDTNTEKPAGRAAGDMSWAIDTNQLFTWTGSVWQQINTGGTDLSGEPFLTSTATTGLSADRVLTAGTNTTVDTGTAGQIKVNFSGSIAESSVTGLVTDLSGKVPTGRSVATTAPLAGGGDLSSDRTLTVATFGSGASGVVPASGGGTTNFLRADGAWTAPAGGGGGPTVARVTADVANNSNTVWADVTGLTKAVSAATTYTYECRLTYITAVTTTALHLSTNGPASPTAHRYAVVVGTTATAKHESSQTAYNTVTNPATGGGATVLTAVISGTFENGANAGTLAIRFKSEIASSAVTVQRGSACRFY